MKSESKLLFVLGGYPLSGKESVAYQLLPILNENTVSEITIAEGAAASAIWGSRGVHGVIILTTTKNRKTKKKIMIIQKEHKKKH